ncbi:proline and serine-rich protein 2 [Astyanax mexicanus]|uniref:Proline and serine-rich protein 2 n=1 Tax=Astyanax mexicanus TaxID=7994 RepID=A0A8T2M860_ASTMX|nr:proline and serine-rich protein 2 [Astyanax mexicanus]
MDIHVHGNPRLHFGHNGYLQPPHSKEDGLQFLSLEEKECILFFEETIDALEEGLEDEGTEQSSGRSTPVEDVRATSRPAVNSVPNTAIAPSLIEHDIIDLVHTTPNYSTPDFHSLPVAPETHFEIKPKRKPTESLPTTADASEDNIHQPPPGSVPTPVIIASHLAEHQGTSGSSSLNSVLNQRRSSLEAPHIPPSRHGPPTHAKPHRLPDNITIMRGSQDPSPQSIATAAVNMQERRSQVLSNLPPSAHPLQGGEPACVRNPPSRSVSFTDPTPNKSRMEALSMLGLTQGRTPSVTSIKTESGNATSATHASHASKVGSGADVAIKSAHSYTSIANNASISPNSTVSQKNSANKVSYSADRASNSAKSANISPNTSMSQKKPSSTFTPSSPTSYEPKSNSYGGRSAVITPATSSTFANHANQDSRPSSAPAPLSAEVTHSDFNSYGGKTIVLNPTASFKAESSPSPAGSSPVKPEPAETHINSFGGRSKVFNPSTHTDLLDGPDYRPRSNSHSPSNTITATTHHTDLQNKSRIFPPAKAESQHTVYHYSGPARDEAPPDINTHEAKPKAVSPMHPDPVYQPISRSRLSSAPPAPAPKPHRPTASLRPRPDPIPAEIRSRPPPKASFRTQGITVQFSGKGATDEARRDALRKLGLLKNTS